MKNVQIPYELFMDLVLYHLRGENNFDEEIRQGLEQKIDAMLNRQRDFQKSLCWWAVNMSNVCCK